MMPVRDEIDEDVTREKIIEPLCKKIAIDLGYQKMFLPTGYDGLQNLSAVNHCLIQEQLCRADTGISQNVGCTQWAAMPAIFGYLNGSPVGKAFGKAVLDVIGPKLASDELYTGCYHMSEPESGCDIENWQNEGKLIRTRAKLEGEEWVINGSKFWTTNAGIANFNCVVCNMDPNLGIDAFTIVYFPEPWPGVSHGKFEAKCGLKSERNTSTFFDDVRAPKEWGLHGKEAWNMFKLINTIFPMVATSAVAIGLLQGAFDTLLDYAGKRIVGGKPCRQHLSSATILADIATTIETARSALLLLAYEYDHPEVYGSLDSIALNGKAHGLHTYISTAAPQLILKGMQLMGSAGYVRENHYEKYYRDAAELQLWLGGVQLGQFQVCESYYDLDYSSFGPGRIAPSHENPI
jgi:alkylation response protein AidB-like acyl-CoA dehydrogenase